MSNSKLLLMTYNGKPATAILKPICGLVATPKADVPENLILKLKLHSVGSGWRGKCPACGYGKDAFSLTARKGKIIGHCFCCEDTQTIARFLRKLQKQFDLPQVEDAVQAEAEVAAEKQKSAPEYWEDSVPAAETPAATYLAHRALAGLTDSPALRFCKSARHPTTNTKSL